MAEPKRQFGLPAQERQAEEKEGKVLRFPDIAKLKELYRESSELREEINVLVDGIARLDDTPEKSAGDVRELKKLLAAREELLSKLDAILREREMLEQEIVEEGTEGQMTIREVVAALHENGGGIFSGMTRNEKEELEEIKNRKDRRLVAISYKTLRRLPLTDSEVKRLYGKSSKQSEEVIERALIGRDRIADAPIALGRGPEEIASSEEEVTEKTRVYIGPLYPGVFQNRNLKEIYAEFPGRRLQKEKLEFKVRSRGKYLQMADSAMVRLGRKVKEPNAAREFVSELQEEKDSMFKDELISLSIQELGLEPGATREEISRRATELGLDPMRPEVVLHQVLDSRHPVDRVLVSEIGGKSVFSVAPKEGGTLSQAVGDPSSDETLQYVFSVKKDFVPERKEAGVPKEADIPTMRQPRPEDEVRLREVNREVAQLEEELEIVTEELDRMQKTLKPGEYHEKNKDLDDARKAIRNRLGDMKTERDRIENVVYGKRSSELEELKKVREEIGGAENTPFKEGLTTKEAGDRGLERLTGDIDRTLGKISEKMTDGTSLSRDELRFIYGIDWEIPEDRSERFVQFRDKLSLEEALPVIFECVPEEIALDPKEIHDSTKVYIGSLFKGIFKHPGLEHVYTSFPEGKVEMVKLGIGGRDGASYLEEMETEGRYEWTPDAHVAIRNIKKRDQRELDLVFLNPEQVDGSEMELRPSVIMKIAEGLGLKPVPIEASIAFLVSEMPTVKRYTGTVFMSEPVKLKKGLLKKAKRVLLYTAMNPSSSSNSGKRHVGAYSFALPNYFPFERLAFQRER